MRRSRAQFSIKSMMIIVGVVAVVLAIPSDSRALVPYLGFPCLAVFAAHWIVLRERRRLAACCFGGLAIGINSLYAGACVYPHYMLLPALFLGWMFIVVPTLAGLGAAWASLAAREDAVPRLSSEKACALGLRPDRTPLGDPVDALAAAPGFPVRQAGLEFAR